MTDLRKAAEMALEALETLWDILDDIDTTSDIAKENDAWYRKRVEFLQKKRWDTAITTDGYKLKGGPVEALRQALEHEEKPPVKSYCGGKPNYCTPVDAVSMSQERVDETAKREHEYVIDCPRCGHCCPERKWVGLSDEDIDDLWRRDYFHLHWEFPKTIELILKEKNCG